MVHGDYELWREGGERAVQADPEQDDEQRSWERSGEPALLERGVLPEEQDPERQRRDDDGARAERAHRVPDLAECVVTIALEELELSLPRMVVAERVRDLLEDENDPDAGEHPLMTLDGK